MLLPQDRRSCKTTAFACSGDTKDRDFPNAFLLFRAHLTRAGPVKSAGSPLSTSFLVAKLESIVVETERVEERPTVINDGNERERKKRL